MSFYCEQPKTHLSRVTCCLISILVCHACQVDGLFWPRWSDTRSFISICRKFFVVVSVKCHSECVCKTGWVYRHATNCHWKNCVQYCFCLSPPTHTHIPLMLNETSSQPVHFENVLHWIANCLCVNFFFFCRCDFIGLWVKNKPPIVTTQLNSKYSMFQSPIIAPQRKFCSMFKPPLLMFRV